MVVRNIWEMSDLLIGVQSLYHNITKDHFLGFELAGLSRRVIMFGELCGWKIYGIYGPIEIMQSLETLNLMHWKCLHQYK